MLSLNKEGTRGLSGISNILIRFRCVHCTDKKYIPGDPENICRKIPHNFFRDSSWDFKF